MAESTYLPMFGCDMLHVADLTKDIKGTLTAGPFKAVPGMTEAGWNTNPQKAAFPADNNSSYTSAVTNGEITAGISCADIPPWLQNSLFGYDVDPITKKVSAGQLKGGYKVIKFRFKKSNNSYLYITLYKCKAMPTDRKVTTQGGSINFQTNGFELTCEYTQYNGSFMEMVDTDELPSGVTAADLETEWFEDAVWDPGSVTG